MANSMEPFKINLIDCVGVEASKASAKRHVGIDEDEAFMDGACGEV